MLFVNNGQHKTSKLHRFLNEDRKSTRLNSSHANISYAVFCLKKKHQRPTDPTPHLPAGHGRTMRPPVDHRVVTRIRDGSVRPSSRLFDHRQLTPGADRSAVYQ